MGQARTKPIPSPTLPLKVLEGEGALSERTYPLRERRGNTDLTPGDAPARIKPAPLRERVGEG